MRNLLSRPRALALSCPVLLLAGLVAACTSDGVMTVRPDVDVGVQTAGVMPAPMALPPEATEPTMAPDMSEPDSAMSAPVEVAPAEPQMSEPEPVVDPMSRVEERVIEEPAPTLVAYPRIDRPVAVPQRSTAVMPADEIDCRQELKKLGVKYRDLPTISEGSACHVDFPVKVSAIGSVEMKPAATLTCAMAETFARWTKKELVPTARYKYWSGVKTIHQGSSYSCRNIRGTDRPSEHAHGNALDVMRIELNNGKDIDVRKPGWFAFRQRGFLNTVRADGCDYFTTVLGPGYNADHADHFHFDLMKRRNGHVACK